MREMALGARKAFVKGFVWMLLGILGHVVAPLWVVDLSQQVLLKWGIFYPFNPVPVVLFGVAAAGTLFPMGLLRGECVWHGVAGVARSLATALWLSSFPGLLFVNTFYPIESVVQGVGVTALLDVRGVIMLLAYVTAATALVYVAEVAIGLKKKEYLVYS